jgi:hypothetical protein
MRGDWIVNSAARNVYLSPSGLVAPAFRKIAKVKVWHDWRLNLLTLIAIMVVTAASGFLVANGQEIKNYFLPPDEFMSKLDRFFDNVESIAASGNNLHHDFSAYNTMEFQGSNQSEIGGTGYPSGVVESHYVAPAKIEVNPNVIVQPFIQSPAVSGSSPDMQPNQ